MVHCSVEKKLTRRRIKQLWSLSGTHTPIIDACKLIYSPLPCFHWAAVTWPAFQPFNLGMAALPYFRFRTSTQLKVPWLNNLHKRTMSCIVLTRLVNKFGSCCSEIQPAWGNTSPHSDATPNGTIPLEMSKLEMSLSSKKTIWFPLSGHLPRLFKHILEGRVSQSDQYQDCHRNLQEACD